MAQGSPCFRFKARLVGYEEAAKGKTGGSRRRFISDKFDPIVLHHPNPGNELKSYQIAQVITFYEFMESFRIANACREFERIQGEAREGEDENLHGV